MNSQTTEYALRAMVCLALRPNELLSTSSLSEQSGAPTDYLAKVLQVLSGAGLIDSRRGVGGGYRLTRDPASISLLDVVTAANGKIARVVPRSQGDATPPELLALQEVCDRAAETMKDIYGSCTLADLVNTGGSRNGSKARVASSERA